MVLVSNEGTFLDKNIGMIGKISNLNLVSIC